MKIEQNIKMKTILSFFSFYYFITGLWPFIHYGSFERITGPKKEKWLVYTVSSLIVITSLVVFRSLKEENFLNPTILMLVIGNATALIVIDVLFSYKKIISKVYLLDAFVQIIFLILIALNL